MTLFLSAGVLAWNVDDGVLVDANGSATTLAVQADGKIIVGGSFTTISEGQRGRDKGGRRELRKGSDS